MTRVPVAGDGPRDSPPMPSGRCPVHGTRAHVAITGGQDDALRCRLSTCCTAFADQITGYVQA